MLPNYFLFIAAAGVWLLGAVATGAAIQTLGAKSPYTLGESFSGDDVLDFIICGVWFIFWPCWFVYWLTKRSLDKLT